MNTIWARCKEVLRTKVNEHTMTTWFEPIICEDVSEDRVVLSVPNNFFIHWIKDNYIKLFRESLIEATGKALEPDFRSRDDFACDDTSPIAEKQCEEMLESLSMTDEFALKRNLNPRYTFESFVVGACNQFAHAAALSVTENLGKSYNPLFLYGGVGLGKTHLMSAVGYAVLSKQKTKKVSFSTSEEFTNEMINAIRYDRMVEFRNKYRNVDLLLIDDIQFIAGKERTQEEFFHTFNAIYEARKQIVITSDRFPNDISEMEHRLKSRFGWGLVADMGVPDLETKVAILKRKAFEDAVELPDDVAYFLAEQVESNIRELVGYFIRVIAMSTLQGIPLTRDLAQLALKEILHRHSKNITVEDIISVVSKAFNIKTSDIKSKKKHKLYSLPRQVGMYLGRELTELSYPDIGAAFGGKDHSTVIYACRKIEKKMEQDHSLKNLVEGLRKDIRG
ncbi:MAG TPA: chromosomal replication initiator protein DnaA [Desulfomonilaceae bacterium]|nr:chromosomal replication initiator protein DnaA [Desulfomonilaceae bacterium]